MEKPNWLVKANIILSLDAREILARGEHPLEKVLSETSTLKTGEIYEIITPFPPMPMIGKLNDLGFESHFENDDEGLFHTYFCKR